MPYYQITTPEQVRFRYEIAGLASRAMAWVMDQLILWALRIGIFAGLAQLGLFGITAALLGVFVLDFGYYAYFEMYQAGQTPGKRRFKLRVITTSGARLGFADVMIRNLLRSVDTLPYVMTLGGIVAMCNSEHRRLGDLAAGTIVIRDAHQAAPEALSTQRDRDNSYQQPEIRGRINARITRDERDFIYDLVMRRDQIEPENRESLFTQAAEHFRQRYGLPDDAEHLSDEQTVLNIALVIQADNEASVKSVGSA